MKNLHFRASNRWATLARHAGAAAPMIAAAAAAAAAAALNHAARRFMQRPLPPQNSALLVDGLRRPVEVLRDPWGLPHIYAQNEHDLFFAQGYVMAQDRLFQMDANRRVGAGRISEIVGPAGLESDRFARYFGWQRAARAQAASADAEIRDILSAFTAGVNAFIAAGKLPLEYTLLAFKPEPWRVLDSAAWGTVLAWGLSVNWETELLRAMLIETFGPEKAADLAPNYVDSYETIMPDAQVGQRLALELIKAYREAMTYLPLGDALVGSGVGSNNWVVNGAHTQSGRPILANDPHLPPIFPTLWYANHLVGGGYNVTGFTTPGVPGVIIGHNERVAWGVTNAFPDVQDLYIERFHPDDPSLYLAEEEWVPAEMVTEIIKVRGRKPLVETVRYTRHGPVISDLIRGEKRDLALRWASYGRNNHMRAIVETNRATDWHTFRDGLRYWGFPSQNVVYADVDGNIGYMMPGLVPRRKKGAGLAPTPGWDSEYEWVGWIPFEELPSRYNPPEGVIATANNRVFGTHYPHLLTGEWLPDYRAARILELIKAYTPLTLADNGRIQNDTVSLQARRFMNAALPLLAAHAFTRADEVHALRILQQWECDMRADRIAPGLYFGALVHFTHACVAQAVGPELGAALMRRDSDVGFPSHPFHEIAYELALNWLENGAPAWVGDVRPLLPAAFAQTVAVLRAQFGPNPVRWQWGKMHRVELHNVLARIPGLGRLWKPISLPVGGDGYTVNQADVTPHFPPDPVHVIASCRLLLDVGDWDASLAVLPGGQSAHVASPHYQDQVDDWRNGRYHPFLFSRARIEAAGAGRLLLNPLRSNGRQS